MKLNVIVKNSTSNVTKTWRPSQNANEKSRLEFVPWRTRSVISRRRKTWVETEFTLICTNCCVSLYRNCLEKRAWTRLILLIAVSRPLVVVLSEITTKMRFLTIRRSKAQKVAVHRSPVVTLLTTIKCGHAKVVIVNFTITISLRTIISDHAPTWTKCWRRKIFPKTKRRWTVQFVCLRSIRTRPSPSTKNRSTNTFQARLWPLKNQKQLLDDHSRANVQSVNHFKTKHWI